MNPPSLAPEGQELATVTDLCEAVGLPRAYVTRDLAVRYIVPCVWVTFTDGELSLPHAVETDPVLCEHFGETNFDDGVFGARMRDLFGHEDPKIRYALDELVRICGRKLATVAVNKPSTLPLFATVILNSVNSTVGFAGHTVELNRPLRTVVDYGPGVNGRFHIETQWQDIRTHRSTFAYFPITRGPFINEFLMAYWGAHTRNPAMVSQVVGRVYMGREDGMASASDHLVHAQHEATGSPEMADLVIASGVYAAGRVEIRRALANAYELLHTGGALLVRSPESVDDPDAVAAAEMTDIIVGAGFDGRCSQFVSMSAVGAGAPACVKVVSTVFWK